MKWLQDNPLGMALAAISGIFILIALVMAIVWNLPVSVETAEIAAQETAGGGTVRMAHQVADMNALQVINEKPVFNESRLPVVEEVVDGEDELDLTVAIKDAPDVRLTGVIITPGMKIASLTPADGKLESVMAHEGQPLTGEFAGWQVSSVSPRTVVLESRDGQTLELELQVHDVKIKEPPKPVAAKPAAAEGEQPVSEDGQPLSRAEQIRQRIAERREELRREQEEQQAQGEARTDRASKPAQPQDYQSAIRALMNNKPKDQGSDDKKDG